MPTLKELIETDLGVSDFAKTASDETSSSRDIDALAAQLGLGLSFSKIAQENGEEEGKKVEEEEEEEEEEEGEEKEASAGSLYDQLFPEDETLSKTAEEQKVAAYQENLGARSYDYCAARWDRRIEKLAADVLSGNATISAPTGDSTADVHGLSPTPDQLLDNNMPDDASDPIDHTPVVTNELPGKNEEKVVGDVQQKTAALQEAAMRKAWLLSNLEG